MSQESPKQVRAREYRRLSDSKGGTSLQRQAANNAEAAAGNGWILGEPYIDDGLSASKYARKKRDDFENLVADLQTGPSGSESDFAADVLMLWESARGSRQVGEWVSLIELCEKRAVKIWVTTHKRLYDPRNGRDRKSLLEDAIDSEYESYKTHERVSGTAAFEATRGRPHGKAPDGLTAVYDPKTGDLSTWVENPERSEIPKELFRLLEAGFNLSGIAQRFETAGYLNASGSPYTREHLRDMALRHAYAGLRFHNGKVHEGIWDGIVSEERFWTVQQILNDPSRKTSPRGGKAIHELTAGLRCGVCESLHAVTSKHGHPVYRCQQSCLLIRKAPVDDLIIGTAEDPGTLLTYLARDDLHQLLARPSSDDASVREIRARLTQARTERDELREAKGRNLAEIRVLANSLVALEAEVEQLEARERELTLPPVLLKMIKPGADVWESWRQAPVSARREVVRIVLSPRLLGRVYIHPSPRTGRDQPILERIEYRRAEM
ncbi:recombinase family protein [Streptomyces sp. NBC_00827]|uniref:recombinase family protein n=1 Tax=Streptomyces sp. NBC_00827 TaxID=2903677 RepID=UPI00386E3AEC|nr:recombinase family protein [Streptomyces sp. NBC_00827]